MKTYSMFEETEDSLLDYPLAGCIYIPLRDYTYDDDDDDDDFEEISASSSTSSATSFYNEKKVRF